MSNHAETIILRRARSDEHRELEQFQAHASLEIPDYRHRLLSDPAAVHLPPAQIANGQVIVAEYRGQVAGFVAVVGGELDGLFVEPDLRGRGIARALVDAATKQARQKGLALTVIAKPSARRFYESCGFSLEGEEPTRFGPGLKMSK